MKILHTSDIHLGKRVNEFPMLKDLRCTHKRDKMTGEHTASFIATSPGSRFPKRRFIRARDEAHRMSVRKRYAFHC